MRLLLLLPLLAALLLATSCVPFVLPTPTPIPTLTPEVFAEVPFTTVDVYAITDTGDRALLPDYVGVPDLPRGPGEVQNGYRYIGLMESSVFVLEHADPSSQAFFVLPEETQEAVSRVDFGEYVVIVLLHEGTVVDTFGFIKQIRIDREGMRVDVETWRKPNLGEALNAQEYLPYHVVKVQRSDLPADWTQERYPVRVAVTEIAGDLRPPTPTPMH